ncbi:hypothetical protein HB904_08560 [Listeria booriae]|uniref:Rhamnogalacturonase A/B/Epimerase-like pectate lyase domain-containing protein n=1 Tax=Listeria booriae TaxID=1552123 RepID=A0A841YMH3_9LIST|nr:glycosyl hydrolase family 28-related protein [Listeria booriae]MBC1401224.1 hypothetical protein [Listeria booriae]MBC1616237.1 hypothetical protein [Listeria booriae]
MSKTIMYIAGFFLSFLILFSLPNNTQASTVLLSQGTTPEIATKNAAALQNAINQASASGKKQVTLPAGTFYINGKIILKSHIALQGASSSPAATKLTMNNAPMTTDTTATSQESTTDIILQNFTLQYNPNMSKYNYLTNPTNFYKDNLLNIGQIAPSESNTGYNPTHKKALKTNIKINNMILNANQVGLAVVYIAKADNVTINQTQILNSGLQNGISMTYTSNIKITNNTVKNIGRAGIVQYYGNTKSLISGNKVIDWMQRYGSYNYDAVKKSGQTLDSMQDAAIDSYGPANQTTTITNNQINLSAASGKVNPNNPLIAKKWHLKTVPNYTRYAAFRASGAQYMLYQGNTVNIDSPSTFTFFSTNMRKSNTLTRPKGITVIGNRFTSRNIDYPFRIFAGISDPYTTNGITISGNTIQILGTINNYYRTLIEVHEVPITVNGKPSYYTTDLLSVTNNKIQTKNISTLVTGASASKKDTLKLLFLNNNTLNGKTYQISRNYIGTTLKTSSYKNNALQSTIIWNADETKTKYIRVTNLSGKAITSEIALTKTKNPTITFKTKLTRGSLIKIQISEVKGNYTNASTVFFKVP